MSDNTDPRDAIIAELQRQLAEVMDETRKVLEATEEAAQLQERLHAAELEKQANEMKAAALERESDIRRDVRDVYTSFIETQASVLQTLEKAKAERNVAPVESNRDHVPTKSLLTKELRERGAKYDSGSGDDLDYLPQVTVCRHCNSSFSPDENYLLCVLHAVMVGSLYPDPMKYPEAATILRSNRHVVRSLKTRPDGQLLLFDDLQPFTLFPDPDKVRRVIVKNARGHAYHENGEPLLETPDHIAFVPLALLSSEQREPASARNLPSGRRSAAA